MPASPRKDREGPRRPPAQVGPGAGPQARTGGADEAPPRFGSALRGAGTVPRTRVSAALRLRSRLLDVYRYATTDTNRFPHSSDTKMGEQGGIYVLDGEL